MTQERLSSHAGVATSMGLSTSVGSTLIGLVMLTTITGNQHPATIHFLSTSQLPREWRNDARECTWVFYFFESVLSSPSWFGLDSSQVSHCSPRTQELRCPCRLSSAISCYDTLGHWASRFMIMALRFYRIHQSGRAFTFSFAEGSAEGSRSPCNPSPLGSVTG